ncbi:uncharacterized protein LOC126607240 isoform X1 [Malus sylvestris]|uniref:uncharacterized protein LOC126607240 isoform X1 n=1 Tax=Malus sylvestris TaxID=3752 RepID=UPI0021ACA3A9|nr:uncharacterized protein LOC126607240 isoform X1 [Malus sylvestris]
MRAQIDSREPPRCCSNLVAKHLFSPKVSFYFRLIWFSLNESKITRLEPVVSKKASSLSKKGRTQCTRLPLYAGSERGECRLTLSSFMERLLPSLEPETYRSWAKALAIAPAFAHERPLPG